MPRYMLLIYAPADGGPPPGFPGDQLSRWYDFTESLRDAGLLVGLGRLHGVESATTVRVRDGETLITDGPFAETAEFLAGYYLLDCQDLDKALEHAARVPHIHYGSVEVRPMMDAGEPFTPEEVAAQA